MFANIIEQKRRERLPEDSGEWLPVPLRFRHLPPPRNPGDRRKFTAISAVTALTQALLLGLVTWAGFEFLQEGDFPVLMVLATVIGLLTSMAAGAWLAHQYWLDTADTDRVLMRCQLWWLVLLLIPCYGWSALIVLGMPCVFGTMLGVRLGAMLGHRQEA